MHLSTFTARKVIFVYFDRRHKRQTVCKDHVVMELGGSLGAEQLKKFDNSQCVLHKGELIKLYCLDCRLLVCFVCFAEQHNTHK